MEWMELFLEEYGRYLKVKRGVRVVREEGEALCEIVAPSCRHPL
jgi:hypothetical protein